MTQDERIYLEAAKYLGTQEAPGPGSTPLIKKWIKQAATWLNGDDSATAWCGCFRGAIGLATATGVPREHYRAAEWALWGQMVNRHAPPDWRRGMTAILTRPGGSHVALIDRVKGDRVYLLGGNQSNCVCIQSYPIASVIAVRTAG